MTSSAIIRCFGDDDPLMAKYHDEEWGVPLHDDRLLFEAIVLDGAQAGLSWRTILRKRENYRKAFDNFDPMIVARYGESERTRLLADSGIVRNKLKIDSAISNAVHVLEVQGEFGTFDKYLWQFTGHRTMRRSGLLLLSKAPTETDESRTMSKDLQKRGFRFVGPTICYAMMQAIGMVNDHMGTCFRAAKPG